MDNASPEHAGKKPYYKYHHRHRPHKPKPADTSAQHNADDSTAIRQLGYEALQPDTTEVSTGDGQKKNDAAKSSNNRRRRRRNDKYRKNNKRSDEFSTDANSETEAEETKISHTADNADYSYTVSEYVTTAGSIDDEVVDELNSITQSEAEALVLEEPVSEAELAKYEIVGIRFKAGGKIYYFDPKDGIFNKGEAVIVETSRGLEYGVCEIANRTVTEREVVLPLRTVVRRATPEDTARHEANAVQEKEAFAICTQKILDHNLGMKLVDVEYAFDGSKLLFYFTAEGRVDFRELVKDLASVFRTRIELRQIGIRDETKLLGGIGICGRPFCCKTFLSDFVQVSIKMAKEQNLSLNSVKISGACGRLMCCLRYEYDVYQEEAKKTPKVDQIVATPDGEGTVIEVQPLAGLVRVRFGTKADMLTPKVYYRDEVKVIGGKGVKPKDQPSE